MNLYLRHFDNETIVKTVEEAIYFLENNTNVEVDDYIISEVSNYVNGDFPYSKRVKLRERSYFIMIKTLAENMEEFKAYGENSLIIPEESEKDVIMRELNQEQPGWYLGTILFKRMIQDPETGKARYEDTEFSARVKTSSPMECYNRIVEHLQKRDDVDKRSQFPSIKGRNFTYTFEGE